jgi:hypothetical protein
MTHFAGVGTAPVRSSLSFALSLAGIMSNKRNPQIMHYGKKTGLFFLIHLSSKNSRYAPHHLGEHAILCGF